MMDTNSGSVVLKGWIVKFGPLSTKIINIWKHGERSMPETGAVPWGFVFASGRLVKRRLFCLRNVFHGDEKRVAPARDDPIRYPIDFIY